MPIHVQRRHGLLFYEIVRLRTVHDADRIAWRIREISATGNGGRRKLYIRRADVRDFAENHNRDGRRDRTRIKGTNRIGQRQAGRPGQRYPRPGAGVYRGRRKDSREY